MYWFLISNHQYLISLGLCSEYDFWGEHILILRICTNSCLLLHPYIPLSDYHIFLHYHSIFSSDFQYFRSSLCSTSLNVVVQNVHFQAVRFSHLEAKKIKSYMYKFQHKSRWSFITRGKIFQKLTLNMMSATNVFIEDVPCSSVHIQHIIILWIMLWN